MKPNPAAPPFKADSSYGSENKAIDQAFRVLEVPLPPKARTDRTLTVCAEKELPPGSRRIVRDGTRSIGVFNLEGKFYAVLNVCPHAGAPLCQGHFQTTHRPSEPQTYEPAFAGRILRCPWHGWEFDIVTGKGLYDARSRVPVFPVSVSATGDIVVHF